MSEGVLPCTPVSELVSVSVWSFITDIALTAPGFLLLSDKH